FPCWRWGKDSVAFHRRPELFRFFSVAAICGRTGTKLPCPREPALYFFEHRFIDIDSRVGFRVIGFLNSPGLGANRHRHQSRYWTSVTKNHNGLASLDEIRVHTIASSHPQLELP